jgi:hypothetical protein
MKKIKIFALLTMLCSLTISSFSTNVDSLWVFPNPFNSITVIHFDIAQYDQKLSDVTSSNQQDAFIMTYPNIYFKLNSTEYAKMPYSVDSVFKCIVTGIKNKGTLSLSIWRDSVETEQLSKKRIIKFKHDLNKYIDSDKIIIQLCPYSWQSTAEVLKKGQNPAMYKEYILTLSSMIEVCILDYSPPVQ